MSYSDSGQNVYDLTLAKRLDRFMSPDVLMRIAMTGLVLTSLWAFFNLWQVFILFAAYVAALIIHGSVVTLMPVLVDFRRARLVQVTSVLVGSSWTAALAFLWLQDDMAVRLVALMGLFLSMLNALMARREDDLLIVADLINIMGSIAVLTLVSWYWKDASGEAISLLISGSLGFVFFCYGLVEVRKVSAELAQAQAERAESGRREAMGRMTGGLAHDFNNLLAVIHGNLDLIREIEAPEQKDELARQALHATQQAAQVTSQLLTFVGRGPLDPVDTGIGYTLERVAQKAERLLTSDIELCLNIEPDLPILFVDTEQFEKLILNLCVNARNAMPRGGDLVITARRMRSGDPLPSALEPGGYVCIDVTDSGIGIAPDMIDRVFEPYFTTRARGGGLGLASARGFAVQSGGALTISSKLDVGTIVTLTLPVPVQKS